jgi:hypothetical protein
LKKIVEEHKEEIIKKYIEEFTAIDNYDNKKQPKEGSQTSCFTL